MRDRTQLFDPRQSMCRADYEIFHYRDESLSDVEVHHHDFFEVYLFLSGQVEYRVEGQLYHPQPGDLILINPMELHQPILHPGKQPYERIVLWISKAYLERFDRDAESLIRCFDTSLPAHSNLVHPTPSQREGTLSSVPQLWHRPTPLCMLSFQTQGQPALANGPPHLFLFSLFLDQYYP